MDRVITTAIFLSVFKAALCFNIDPVAWKSLRNGAAGFGYQVVQRGGDLLVSAPLEQYSPNGRGQIYKCTATTSCSQLPVQLPPFAVNTSLGLAMTNDPRTQNTMACGPTIPKDCTSITMYNGICVEIYRSDLVGPPMPSSLEVCRSAADIAFLLDGSGSVAYTDFQRMKTFVKDLVRSFRGKETQFAISQFSSAYVTHYFFNTFDENQMETQIDRIRQLTGGTYTATAIEGVVREVFIPSRGSRPNVRKILVVITDGESQERNMLPSAARSAEDKKIVRFAIGVGDAFFKYDAKQELNTIASDPSESHVFQVDNFDALEQIRQNLQDKIFSIEGSQSSGESLKLEMSQEGFSAAYVSGGVQMAVVGANQWRGGYMRYTGNTKKPYEPDFIMTDSYLGYSMAVAKTGRGDLTIIGAPRYDHRGVVLTVDTNNRARKIDPFPWQFQSGEYFGAEVCAMDVDRDGYTDLLLISAPMYVDSDREGRVYVCSLSLNDVECKFESPSVLRGVPSNKGRFGSSLAVLPDLNMDGFKDLAVGAPLENDGQGSIYIFHSEGRKISLTHSQRIAASEVQPGLKFFGMSISQSSYDHSSDRLPDLAVGSKGVVVLLRSKPIVMVEATVSFSPNQIPIQNSLQCSSMENRARICFTMSRHSEVTEARARINFTLTLDATRKVPNNRAYIAEKQRTETRSIIITLERPVCETVDFFIEGCPEDALNALSNELRFTFDGLPSNNKLSPSLAQQAQTTTFHSLGFEINCGADNECVDNLKVDFNFTSSSVVQVGIDDLLDVTVSVENRGENSYNSRIILTYPPGLSYRKFAMLQGRIDCNSLDSENGIMRGKTDCSIDKPIFKSNAKALFIVSYGIDTNSQLDRTIYLTTNATSGNQDHSILSQLYKKREIDVKYSIFVTFESRLSYYNFTFGKNDLQKPVKQEVVVTNDIRVLNFTVVIKVPVKLGDKNIWVDSSILQFPNCKTEDAEPNITDFVAEIQKTKIVDCSVAKCKVFKCSRLMGKLESETFRISANLSSGWIEQIGLQSAKFLLTSTASMEYDREKYIFALSGSNNNPPVRKIEAEVEVYPELDFTKEIVGGSLGGLALLALITAGLYKAGFFKSKYKEMISDAADTGADGAEPMADQQA